ncbi:hypothetical protein B0T24DRAFT_619303 [Lasiosphaeria ovina]|uniref:Uncharacterized protein n=1 Tax=Lasiosphaeria ovina TaxID=92902 RepID=A0AAE0KHH9_9PEZI|nr:hypothetical protein B0T24DRAFT_619303 [Lasiosphaeria ovina]
MGAHLLFTPAAAILYHDSWYYRYILSFCFGMVWWGGRALWYGENGWYRCLCLLIGVCMVMAARAENTARGNKGHFVVGAAGANGGDVW